jgi:hypothetical protein
VCRSPPTVAGAVYTGRGAYSESGLHRKLNERIDELAADLLATQQALTEEREAHAAERALREERERELAAARLRIEQVRSVGHFRLSSFQLARSIGCTSVLYLAVAMC